jgi:hypothetical protein
MVTPDEQRSLQVENSKADEQFWSSSRDTHAEKVEGHKGLVATVERAIAAGQAGIAEADGKTAAAKERLDRLARVSPSPAGSTSRSCSKMLYKEAGWTASEVRRALLTYAIGEAGRFEMLMAEIDRPPRPS